MWFLKILECYYHVFQYFFFLIGLSSNPSHTPSSNLFQTELIIVPHNLLFFLSSQQNQYSLSLLSAFQQLFLTCVYWVHPESSVIRIAKIKLLFCKSFSCGSIPKVKTGIISGCHGSKLNRLLVKAIKVS